MKRVVIIIIVNFFFHQVFAQPRQQLTSSEILQGIKKLNVVGSVLYIAAHPDDENTRFLTYLSKEKKLRTGYLSITRGDGGQNLVGKEQAELLGVIRTQELLAARRIDGAEQFFTRANDFGYSKNPEETFKIWNKDTILSDMVWIIRNFKPDMIICRFPTTGEGGHGHHTASAILALEAFDAAADPSRFSWQLKFSDTWKTKSVFWNSFNPGNNPPPTDQLKLDVGGFNSLLGKSYGEIAAESRSMHKSQGFGSAKTRGSQIEYFKQLRGDSVKSDLFENVDLTWKRLGDPGNISGKINECIRNFNPEIPSKSIPELKLIHAALKNIPENDSYKLEWKKKKLKEVESLIVDCAGLWVEAFADSYSGIPGRKIEITTQAINRSEALINLKHIEWSATSDTTATIPLLKNILNTYKRTILLDEKITYSNPYWLNESHNEGYFTVRDPQLILKPENPPAYIVSFDAEVEGLQLRIERPLMYKSADPIKGEIYRPFEVLPAVSINFSARSFAFGQGTNTKIVLNVTSHIDSANGKVMIRIPEGWKAVPSEFSFDNLKKNDQRVLETIVTAPSETSQGYISAEILLDNKKISLGIYRIDYDHIPSQFMLTEARAKLNSFDIKFGGRNVGYIPGAGDEVAECLTQFGYNVTILNDEMLAKTNLSSFDAIVTGIRAYNTNEWLPNHSERLLSYIREGGNFIMQYNTNSRVGPLISKISPYPFNISRERVTDENAEVRFVNGSHSALNYPNKISSDDFKGWRQERGIYFASDLDSAYEKVLSMNDPGEKPNEGSLIVARYGKGNFVYSGIVFFRELPAGVPGAYKLFVNLLSLPKNK
jgi:LmbE family N-acetylglucosaminyl deacetylase